MPKGVIFLKNLQFSLLDGIFSYKTCQKVHFQLKIHLKIIIYRVKSCNCDENRHNIAISLAGNKLTKF